MTVPALLDAPCSYSAWSLTALQRKPTTLDMVYHKSGSIRLLSESLRNLNDSVPSDSITLLNLLYCVRGIFLPSYDKHLNTTVPD